VIDRITSRASTDSLSSSGASTSQATKVNESQGMN
jgi:hypothetical protein